MSYYAKCVQCRAEFTEAQIAKAYACPACGSTGVPMKSDDDVAVNINWHELRILVIWAERFAFECAQKNLAENARMPQTVSAIAKALQEQFPSQTPLTLAGELGQLQKKFGRIEVHGLPEPDDNAEKIQ